MRDSFIAARTRRPELRYTGLVEVAAVQAEETGLIYSCLLQWERPVKSLEEETIERGRAGRGWSEEDVKQMLLNLSAGLAYAQSCGMCASDLSPRNVMYVEDTFQILDLHEVSGVSADLQMAFLLPEWREDIGKASVWALGLLAIWMLRLDPDNCELPAGLEPVLGQMLNKQLCDPNLLASLVNEAWGPPPIQIFQTSLDTQDFAQAVSILPHLLDSSLQVNATFLCSGCSCQIPLPCATNVMSICERHLTCTLFCLVQASNARGLTATSRCPFCEPRRRLVIKSKSSQQQCKRCSHQFTVGQEAWRLQLIGSSNCVEARNYCSEACFLFVHTSEVIVREVPDDFSEYIYLTLELMQGTILRGKMRDSPEHLACFYQVFLFKMLSKTLGTESFTCHFCGELQNDLGMCRWLWCASGVKLVCSVACLRGFLDVTDDKQVSSKQCPTCLQMVSGKRIEETLRFSSPMDLPLRSYCLQCQQPSTSTLQCKHTYCDSCLQSRCPRCEYLEAYWARSSEEAREEDE